MSDQPAVEVIVSCPMCTGTLPLPWSWEGHEGYGGERLSVSCEAIVRAFLRHDEKARHPLVTDGSLHAYVRCTECGVLVDTFAEAHRTASGWLLTVLGNQMAAGMARHVDSAHEQLVAL